MTPGLLAYAIFDGPTGSVEVSQTVYLGLNVFRLGIATNAGSPSLKVVDPLGSPTTPALTQGVQGGTDTTQTGAYWTTWPITAEGLWKYTAYDGTVNLGSGEFSAISKAA